MCTFLILASSSGCISEDTVLEKKKSQYSGLDKTLLWLLPATVRCYLFEIPVHVELLHLSQFTVLQGGSVASAWINQATVIVIFVRFKSPNDDFTICVVVAILVKKK